MQFTPYPFAAIVGQEQMKLALILNVINPQISGVLIRGEKGTAKSTAVRALADILPEIEVVAGDPFQTAPGDTWRGSHEPPGPSIQRKVRVVELPVGATEDRLVGTLDLEYALKHGEKRFEPGLLAAAHRGMLYVDEVNLLDDHLVDVLLDAAAMGVNTVEREGVSFAHPARFTLVGTMNPEEGELRPQLLDRFGLCVTVAGISGTAERVEIMERRLAYEADPHAFAHQWAAASQQIRERIAAAIALHPQVLAERHHLLTIATQCQELGVDGHRADIITLKTAKALAAWHGRTQVETDDLRLAGELSLPHRMRRLPFEAVGEVRR
ncbi:ATP-binding protein [Candidatus Oscillochloris fontis]|uniref:ATP-binding protein n=1 Tax=Candidatus Oscillochloris fontis TaxID=2496868 RepID=UPI00101D1F81|nr:ATP-binding protein [Candidatus Oscillochloris fontis]